MKATRSINSHGEEAQIGDKVQSGSVVGEIVGFKFMHEDGWADEIVVRFPDNICETYGRSEYRWSPEAVAFTVY